MVDTASDLRVVATDGITLVASLRPDHDGTPVVLLHGLSQQRRFWDPVARRMRSRPLAALDQRGHGDTDTDLSADYSIDACAGDVTSLMDVLGWDRVVLCGHSWGASVAVAAAARMPERVAGVALIDGGLWSLEGLGPRDEVRTRLTPPSLDLPVDELWSRIAGGDLSATWSEETRQALTGTFVVSAEGRARTRIGVDRHLRVLDGMLDYDPAVDLDACEERGLPVWAAVCQPSGPPSEDPWARVKADGTARAAARSNVLVHRWEGASHDVPLQWPALVAGFVDALVEYVARAEGQGGEAR